MPRRPLDYLAGLDDEVAFALIEDAPPHDPPPYSDVRGVADYAEHLDAVRRLGTTANGVFGAKLMWAHLEDLGRRLGSERPARPGRRPVRPAAVRVGAAP